VVITDEPQAPITVASPSILETSPSDDEPVNTAYRWAPQKSPAGPVTVIISGADRRLIVIRNGIEIGSSAIEMDGVVASDAAFTLRTADAEGAHWLRLPLPGQKQSGSSEMTSSEHARVRMPRALRASIITALQPGSTLLVTADSLRGGSTGKRLTLIVGEPAQP
jgi:hypothetical protein